MAICVVLAAIIWAVFGQTLRYGFLNYDDPNYVSENWQIQAGLSWQNVGWAFTHVHSHNWHPLTTISHMFDCQIFGLKPGAHHMVNVLLHSTSVILLFLLLEQMTDSSGTGAIWRSAFVAAVFAIHPLHVESVAWVSERKDVLSGLFFMLTLLTYVHYSRKPTATRYFMVTIWFVLGLLSKPILVTLPAILLLLDYWPLRRARWSEVRVRKDSDLSWQRLIIEKIPLFVLSLGSAVATLIAQRGGILATQYLPFGWRIANAASVYLIYVWQMFWPMNLAVMYPHPGRLRFWETALAAGLLALITAGAFRSRKQRPYFITGWLWYLIMLVPVIGLVQVGSQAHADRYTYLSQIGLYIAVVWGAADYLSDLRYRREICSVAMPLVIALLGWRSWIQTGYWSDTERLWMRTLAVTGRNDFAHFGFGEFLLKDQRLDEAIAQFQIVLSSHPSDPDANFQMGYALMEKGEDAAAIAHFQQTLKSESENPEAETNLGSVLLRVGRIPEAVEYYRSVVRREPSSALAHYNLAVGLHRLGQLPEAITEYKKALAIDPKYPDAEEFLRQAQSQEGEATGTRPDSGKQ